jgi:hypothetical protein
MADQSTQSRLQYLERLADELTKQVKVMKQLLQTELNDLKGGMQQQVTEIKQIVMHQDKIYQERIRRLETRVEQISEFSMHLARSKGIGGVMGAVPPAMTIPAEIGGAEPMTAGSPTAAGGAGGEEDDEEKLTGVRGVLQKYREKLKNVYQFYTSSHATRPLSQVMNLQQFTRMAKDCGLCNSSGVPSSANLPPPEMLWMSIIRKLYKKIQRFKHSHPHLYPHATHHDTSHMVPVNSFAVERQQDLPIEFFPEGMVVLAQDRYGRDRVDMTPEQVLEMFLVTDIFPNVDQRVADTHRRAALTEERRLPTAATSITDYSADDVKAVVREYKTKIKGTFTHYVKKYDRVAEKLFLDGLVEIVKDHGLLPFVTKADVRMIYITALKSGAKEAASPATSPRGRASPQKVSKPLDHVVTDPDDGLTASQFVVALKHMAERIYGDKLYAEKYPTATARMKKLLSKIYLLSGH